MEELKEKLLCALKSNIEKITVDSYWGIKGIIGIYRLEDIKLVKDFKTIEKIIKGKYFWQNTTKYLTEEFYYIDFHKK